MKREYWIMGLFAFSLLVTVIYGGEQQKQAERRQRILDEARRKFENARTINSVREVVRKGYFLGKPARESQRAIIRWIVSDEKPDTAHLLMFSPDFNDSMERIIESPTYGEEVIPK